MKVMQVPIETLKAGLYEWTMTSMDTLVKGHIVVRGADCGPINGWDYEQGMESWYWGTPESYSGNPSFVLTLLLMRDPRDTTLINAIKGVRKTETLVGDAPEVPSWTQGAPLPSSPQVVTLTSVTNGPGQYSQLYNNVSFLMPVDGSPLMPTWYTSISNLYSVFGGSPSTGAPIAEGIQASMSYVQSGGSGYPSPTSWYWYGRDPS